MIGKEKQGGGLYSRAWFRNAASAAAILSATFGYAQLMAGDGVQKITIQAQPLDLAIVELSRQADVFVFVPPELVQGKVAPSVDGQMKPADALATLLQGTNLVFERNNDGAYVVTEKPVAETGSAMTDEDVSFVLEEIIVTATRREASMMDIPMSINAFSGERIRKSGIHDVSGLQFLAAGMHVRTVAGLARIYIRGIGSDSVAVGSESGIAMHRDGVYIPNRGDMSLGFFDTERVEVLRGPQGTLYGRNATGGSVNFISRAPTEVFETGGDVTFGNYNLIETEGYVSGPIVDDYLMARVAFKTSDHDGHTLNLFNGEHLDDRDFSGVRAILRYAPNSDFQLDITMDNAKDNSVYGEKSTRKKNDAPLPWEVAGFILPESPRVINVDDKYAQKKSWGVSSKIKWIGDEFTLESLTAYREYSTLTTGDFDGGPLRSSYLSPDSTSDNQLSQEITLASSGKPLEWIVGAYYFHESIKNAGDLQLVPAGIPHIFYTNNLKGDAYAVFGEGSYAILDRLTLTLGARYSYEEKDISGDSILVFASGAMSGNPAVLSDNWGSFTPKVALTYDLSDEATAYVTVGKGFKSGGYNGATGNPLGAYNPEKVINYELGLKAAFFDNRFRANIAVFQMDYSDLQVRVRRINPITDLDTTVTTNAASSTIRGVELELDGRPTENLSFDANASWLDAAYDRWPDALNFGTPTNVSGYRMQNAPEWAFNLSISYNILIGNWGYAKLRGEYAYKSRVFFTPFQDNFSSEEGFSLINARMVFESADDGWSIAGWIKNITDKDARSYRLERGGDTTNAFFTPRSYGITVGYRF